MTVLHLHGRSIRLHLADPSPRIHLHGARLRGDLGGMPTGLPADDPFAALLRGAEGNMERYREWRELLGRCAGPLSDFLVREYAARLEVGDFPGLAIDPARLRAALEAPVAPFDGETFDRYLGPARGTFKTYDLAGRRELGTFTLLSFWDRENFRLADGRIGKRITGSFAGYVDPRSLPPLEGATVEGVGLGQAHRLAVDEHLASPHRHDITGDARDALEQRLVAQPGIGLQASWPLECVDHQVTTDDRARSVVDERDLVGQAGCPVEQQRQDRDVVGEEADQREHPDAGDEHEHHPVPPQVVQHQTAAMQQPGAQTNTLARHGGGYDLAPTFALRAAVRSMALDQPPATADLTTTRQRHSTGISRSARSRRSPKACACARARWRSSSVLLALSSAANSDSLAR